MFVYKHFDWTKRLNTISKRKKSESLFPTLLLPVFREKWFLTFFLKKNKNKTLLLFLPIYTRCIVCVMSWKRQQQQNNNINKQTTTNLRFECNNVFFYLFDKQMLLLFLLIKQNELFIDKTEHQSTTTITVVIYSCNLKPCVR